LRASVASPASGPPPLPRRGEDFGYPVGPQCRRSDLAKGARTTARVRRPRSRSDCAPHRRFGARTRRGRRLCVCARVAGAPASQSLRRSARARTGSISSRIDTSSCPPAEGAAAAAVAEARRPQPPASLVTATRGAPLAPLLVPRCDSAAAPRSAPRRAALIVHRDGAVVIAPSPMPCRESAGWRGGSHWSLVPTRWEWENACLRGREDRHMAATEGDEPHQPTGRTDSVKQPPDGESPAVRSGSAASSSRASGPGAKYHGHYDRGLHRHGKDGIHAAHSRDQHAAATRNRPRIVHSREPCRWAMHVPDDRRCYSGVRERHSRSGSRAECPFLLHSQEPIAHLERQWPYRRG
jgi:hypothetical protein